MLGANQWSFGLVAKSLVIFAFVQSTTIKACAWSISGWLGGGKSYQVTGKMHKYFPLREGQVTISTSVSTIDGKPNGEPMHSWETYLGIIRFEGKRAHATLHEVGTAKIPTTTYHYEQGALTFSWDETKREWRSSSSIPDPVDGLEFFGLAGDFYPSKDQAPPHSNAPGTPQGAFYKWVHHTSVIIKGTEYRDVFCLEMVPEEVPAHVQMQTQVFYAKNIGRIYMRVESKFTEPNAAWKEFINETFYERSN